MNTGLLLSTLALSLTALSAHAQTFQVASSVAGQQVAGAPINQGDIYYRINIAQGAANVAQGTAADAQWRASNAQNTANSLIARVDRTWELSIADCALALGGVQWLAYCHAVNPRPW